MGITEFARAEEEAAKSRSFKHQALMKKHPEMFDEKGNPIPAVPNVTLPDMVNHPPHYERGPWIDVDFNGDDFTGPSKIGRVVQHIECFRYIKDPRLATAFKYLWRVAFGGKKNDREDIEKAIFYLNDWLDNPVE